MAAKALPTLERARQLLDYDPETGIFRAKVARRPGEAVGVEAGWITPAGYRYIKVDGRAIYAHRLAWLMGHGEWPSHQIDHRNGLRDDNRLSNLRGATSRQNNQNRAIGSSNTSGYLGVSFHKRRGKWQAHIQSAGKLIYLGSFDSPDQAAEAYRNAKARLHDFNPKVRVA